MSLLNKFAAQQLTKKEMNNVKGGKIFLCSVVFCYEVENEFGSTDFASESGPIEEIH